MTRFPSATFPFHPTGGSKSEMEDPFASPSRTGSFLQYFLNSALKPAKTGA
jgi:hypothetical protein